MQAPKKITVTSVSCPTGRNNDCGILTCSFCMAKLVAAEARACGNRRDCQTLYCNDQCAQRAWPQHYRVCSNMTLIKASGSPPGQQQTHEAQMAEYDVQRYKDRVQRESDLRDAKKRKAERMLKDAKRRQEHEEKMRAQDAEIAALKKELERLRRMRVERYGEEESE